MLGSGMEWYYANERDEQVLVDEDELRRLAAEGTVKPGTLVWNESLDGWKPCREVRADWFPVPSTTAPAVSGAVRPADPGPALPQRPRAQQTDGLALASLICGITGLVFLGCYGAGLPISIAAVICGHLSRPRLLREGDGTGAGMALAGLITGYISVGICLLAGLAMVAFILLAAGASTLEP